MIKEPINGTHQRVCWKEALMWLFTKVQTKLQEQPVVIVTPGNKANEGRYPDLFSLLLFLLLSLTVSGWVQDEGTQLMLFFWRTASWEWSKVRRRKGIWRNNQNIQHRFLSIKIFKVILNFTWKTKGLKFWKNKFGDQQRYKDFH